MNDNPLGCPAEEWKARQDLAACYRIFHLMGWTELIYNHISLRVPGRGDGEDKQFLINPFGLHYSEVKASNLVKVDIAGRVLTDGPYRFNAAGFAPHAALHAHQPNAHCVMHTHTTAGMAVAGSARGLSISNFYAAQLGGRVAYHDFEGVTTDLAERPRLVASIGDRPILILRNHGLLVATGSVAETFALMFTLEKACEVQVASDGMAGPNLPIGAEVLAAVPRQNAAIEKASTQPGRMVFDATLRRAGIRYQDLA